jgi:hypothetical protein
MIKDICIIPHFGIKGGSGKYTKQFAEVLSKRYNILFFGAFSKEFSPNIYHEINNFWSIFFKLNIIPNYTGVKKSIKITYTLFSILYSFLWFFKKTNKSPVIFILTSSIQSPLIPLLKKKFINSKIVILIQENFIFDHSFVSNNTIFQIKQANLIYSIDKNWIYNASKFGIKTLLFTNKFHSHKQYVLNKDIKYDFLYVGGDQRIKGFYNLVNVLDGIELLNIPFKVCILGEMSDINKKKLISKKYQFLTIEMLGFVENVFDYISISNFLFFPIESPHFLRPAIEAGMLKKTFVIKKLNSIESFAIDGYNCIMYDTIQDAINAIFKLYRNSELCSELANNNYLISNEFQLKNFNENLFFEDFNSIFN